MIESSASDEVIIQRLMDLFTSHDEQSEKTDTHMVDLINRLLEQQKITADLHAKLTSVRPHPRRHKSDMRRIVFVAGSDDHITGNLKILESKYTGPVHESVTKLVFNCNHEERLDWKENVEQQDVMKSGTKFHRANGETRAADAKRVLRRLAEFAQDVEAVEAEGPNVAIGYGDGWDRIIQCGRLDGIIDTDWFLKGGRAYFGTSTNPGIPFIQGTQQKNSTTRFLYKTSNASYSCRLVVRLCFPLNGSHALGRSIIFGIMPHGQCVMGGFNQWTDPGRCELVHRALDGTLYTVDDELAYNTFAVVRL